MHKTAEVPQRRHQQEVVVIRHENVGIELDIVSFHALPKFVQECEPIRIAREYSASVDSP